MGGIPSCVRGRDAVIRGGGSDSESSGSPSPPPQRRRSSRRVAPVPSRRRPQPETLPPHADVAAELREIWNSTAQSPPPQPQPERLDHTPTGKGEKEKFRFFCPLCMCHLTGVWESTCCKNYTCRECALEYLERKSVPTPAGRIPARELRVGCPHCSTQRFAFSLVHQEAVPREYHDEAEPTQPALFPRGSPVKVGDSMEDLQRKFIRFSDVENSLPPVPEPTEQAGSSEAASPLDAPQGILVAAPRSLSAASEPVIGQERSEESPTPLVGQTSEETVAAEVMPGQHAPDNALPVALLMRMGSGDTEPLSEVSTLPDPDFIPEPDQPPPPSQQPTLSGLHPVDTLLPGSIQTPIPDQDGLAANAGQDLERLPMAMAHRIASRSSQSTRMDGPRSPDPSLAASNPSGSDSSAHISHLPSHPDSVSYLHAPSNPSIALSSAAAEAQAQAQTEAQAEQMRAVSPLHAISLPTPQRPLSSAAHMFPVSPAVPALSVPSSTASSPVVGTAGSGQEHIPVDLSAGPMTVIAQPAVDSSHHPVSAVNLPTVSGFPNHTSVSPPSVLSQLSPTAPVPPATPEVEVQVDVEEPAATPGGRGSEGGHPAVTITHPATSSPQAEGAATGIPSQAAASRRVSRSIRVHPAAAPIESIRAVSPQAPSPASPPVLAPVALSSSVAAPVVVSSDAAEPDVVPASEPVQHGVVVPPSSIPPSQTHLTPPLPRRSLTTGSAVTGGSSSASQAQRPASMRFAGGDDGDALVGHLFGPSPDNASRGSVGSAWTPDTTGSDGLGVGSARSVKSATRAVQALFDDASLTPPQCVPSPVISRDQQGRAVGISCAPDVPLFVSSTSAPSSASTAPAALPATSPPISPSDQPLALAPSAYQGPQDAGEQGSRLVHQPPQATSIHRASSAPAFERAPAGSPPLSSTASRSSSQKPRRQADSMALAGGQHVVPDVSSVGVLDVAVGEGASEGETSFAEDVPDVVFGGGAVGEQSTSIIGLSAAMLGFADVVDNAAEAPTGSTHADVVPVVKFQSSSSTPAGDDDGQAALQS